MNIKQLGLAALMAVAANAAPDPNFHIYLAFGQSNMEGQGDIGNEDKSVDERFQVMWAADNGSCNQGMSKGKWSKAVPPLAHCNGAKLGPTDYFGRTMVEKTDSKIKVGVIVVAVAGCSIKLFDKDNYSSYVSSQRNQDWMIQRINAYGGNPYGRLIEMAKKAQEDGVIKGIIFHQGETDAGDGNWPSAVKKVYDNIVKDLGLGNDIPFLAGEVLRSGSSAGANQNISKLPQQSKNFYVVSSEGFNQALNDNQNVHFTSQEYRDFGKRYAEKMIEVLGDKVKPEATSEPESSSSVEQESSSSVVTSESSSSTVSPGSTDAIAVNPAIAAHIGKAVVNAGRVSVPVKVNGSKVVAKVYSMLGKEVLDFSNSFVDGTLGFGTTGLSQGYYMLSVQVGSEHSVQKVLVR